MDQVGLAILVWIPLVITWAVVIIDLIRRPDLSTGGKWLWAAGCTVVWPALVGYLLVRPPRGRLEVPQARSDPQALLVTAVLDHESGEIDDGEMAATVHRLRRRRDVEGS